MFCDNCERYFNNIIVRADILAKSGDLREIYSVIKDAEIKWWYWANYGTNIRPRQL